MSNAGVGVSMAVHRLHYEGIMTEYRYKVAVRSLKRRRKVVERLL